ncbi:MAG: hypothetical protein LBJ00_16705, partial [Planctomycetaceae bacterium]|nr:hypothetical protein [Planctomycetaceae bacterium]
MSRFVRLSVWAIAFTIFTFGVSEAQQYPTNIKTVYTGSTYCAAHQYANPVVLGAIGTSGEGPAIGLQWQAVSPSGAVIASGTVTNNQVSATLVNGTLYRLRTNGNFFGFKFRGPWGATPVRWVMPGSGSANSSSHDCFEFTPLQIRDVMNVTGREILTYDVAYDQNGNEVKRKNKVLSSGSVLNIPSKTTVRVVTSGGTSIQGLPINVVGEFWNSAGNYYVINLNTETFLTNSSGEVRYCVPNKIDLTDRSGVSVPTTANGDAEQYMCDNPYMFEVVGYFGTHYKGFDYRASIPENVGDGGTTTITVPAQLSTATIERLGSPQNSRTVRVADAGLTEIISGSSIVTDSAGQAPFAIPNGTQFRFYIETTDGVYYSNALTAPSNATIRIIAQNTPALTIPANGSTCGDSDVVVFRWATASSANNYV